MKSTIIKLLFLFFFCGTIMSCKKYLDVKQDSARTLLNTAKDCQLLLDNYDLNSNHPSDGEASADNFYLDAADYNALSEEDRKVYSWAANARRQSSIQQWQRIYKNIYDVNLVLEAVGDKVKGTSDEATLNNLKGSALFIRSFAFYELAQLYAKPYNSSTSTTDPGIPLRTDPDINDASTRGTVEQTYAKIISDLNAAVDLLPVTASIVTRPTKAAAFALLARVYLSMSKYVEAGVAANASLQLKNSLLNYNTLSAASATPFQPRFTNPEVIFHAVTAGTGYFAPNYTPVGASLDPGIAKVDSVLYQSFAASDLRKSIFFKPNSGAAAGTYSFKGNYDGTIENAFFNGLATDEMFLVRAETYARAGNINSAMADLNTLLRNRWLTGTYTDMTAATAAEALAKILTERRKELIFRSLRWTDLRRLNSETNFQKTLTRKVGAESFTLPPNDLRYVLLIPAEVIENSTLAQNPR